MSELRIGNKKVTPILLNNVQGGEDYKHIIIEASQNTLVNNYQVPELSSEQISSICTAISQGIYVVIADASPETKYYVVDQVNSVNSTDCITIDYLNIMKLLYSFDGTISYQEFGGESASYNFGRGLSYDSSLNRISTVDIVLMNDKSNNNGLGVNCTGASIADGAIGIGSNGIVGAGSTAIGYGTEVSTNSTVLGNNSKAYRNCIAIGKEAVAGLVDNSIDGAIQIGPGTNTTNGTMCVGLKTSSSESTNYELLSSNGKIPAARMTNIIDDSSTGNNRTWSADKLYSVIGDVESLINAL